MQSLFQNNYELLGDNYAYLDVHTEPGEQKHLNEKVMYLGIKMPFILSEREALFRQTQRYLKPNQLFVELYSSSHPKFPQRDDRIRVFKLGFLLFEQVGQDIEAKIYRYTDLNG